ncbi:MAG: AAA family ATPase [Bacilli bacterium]|nr:AAA family ATPase [Bacilli bacterium]
MYLKEIQTYGFKSFADKMNFELTRNINGIVGPNGSGKSNVVDAVRWVLGEQSNKQLRADNAVSVIFSGSKSRKPLNSAMVNLIFDNTDRHLPIDFNEVSIKRILYRTGENEYYLNGEKCRLKDITELLTDSGAAKESFNIIGQGKIDEILSTKPNDRRVIFEEAAGVLKYKKRKEEAIRKLERTNNNINRINDIVSELEVNLEPLEKQSREAKKYIDAKEKLTNIEVSLMVYDVDKLSSEFNLCKEKITSLSDEITNLNMNNTTYDVTILQGKDKLNKLENEISILHNKVLVSTKELEQTDADIRILRERKKYVSSDNSFDKISRIREDKLIKDNEIKVIINDIDVLDKKVGIVDSELISDNSKYNEIKNDIDKLNIKINNNNREITDLNYKINYLEESINNGGSLPSSIKAILNNPKFSGIENTIGNLIEVPNEYSLAVSTSLGGASNYLVVDNRNTASLLVDYLKTNKLGRATFFPMDVIKPRFVDNDIIVKLRVVDGFIDTLDKVVSYDSKYINIIMNQLGNVILADNIDNANKISSIINNRYKIITLDGQVVNVGGSITGGDKIKSNDSIRQKYELDEYKNKVNTLRNNNHDYMSLIDNKNQDLKEYENKIYTKRVDKNSMLELIKSKKLISDNLRIEINNLDRELSDIENITTNNSDNEELELVNKYYKIQEDITNMNKELEIFKLDRDKINKDILELEGISKNDNLHIAKLEKELKDTEIKSSKLEVRIDNILNSLNEEYSITYSEAKDKYILEDNPDEVRKEVLELKNIIKDIGIVNLGAIEEYERVSTRYNFLMSQKEDLNKAEDTLLEIINDMDSIMKDKFISTFDEIRMEFKKVFRELFKGGNADIYMTDPDNVLETGIEMEATPPGKNLRNIQSLSGGERTFTAISLLFAILNVRPVPFCLFDEVEAALDEANVDAFGEYLDKYRDKTQFIIITHKKKTMEFIDTLYGITMQESGVSKLVSVKLDEVKNTSN